MKWPHLTVFALALAALAGCATFATHDEYVTYRALRSTTDDAQRLERLNDYAQRFPSGMWINEVRAERTQREDEVWAARNGTPEGIQFYLTVYPDGQYVDLAQQRLAALSTVTARREVETQHVQELHEERRALTAEERRLWVTRATQFWARTIVGLRNFGGTIRQVAGANPEFAEAFGQAPPPLPTPDGFVKHYHAHYAIPVPGATRIEREMHLFLRIRTVSRRVERIEVLLPNKGFSRWYELENRTIVTDEDPEQRQAAIEWAMQRLEPVIIEVASGARAIDVVPEPIAPISQAQQAASATTQEADTEIVGAPQPQPTPEASGGSGSGASGGSQPAEGSLEALLREATGGTGTEPPPEAATPPPVAEEPPPDTSALVLPIGLRALQVRNVRVVVFAAGDEDYGEAYDGFYVERVRE
jgi:hypothetical protein